MKNQERIFTRVDADKLTGEKIVVPEGYTAFEEYWVDLGDQWAEKRGAFTDRLDIVEVILPEGVTEISESLFRRCKNLKRISIPESVVPTSMKLLHNRNRFPTQNSLKHLRDNPTI